MSCPNCGGDNLSDYPVCVVCALTCHFPHRRDCVHCDAAWQISNDDILSEYLRHVEAIADMPPTVKAAIYGTVAAFAHNNKIKIHQEAA